MFQNLTDPRFIKQVLGKEGFEPARSAGQNFLICQEVVEATIELLKAGPKRVTELGAGLGTLTLPLAQAGFEVRAIEKDQKLSRVLTRLGQKNKRGKVEVRQADLRETEWQWNLPYQMAGNIPYNLSGLIFRRITQLTPAPEQAVLLVQKEVGERVGAKVGKHSLLSLAVQLWGKVNRVLDVPADCFWPAPQVQSQLIALLPYKESLLVRKREEILKVAKVFFQQKRKQAGGVLKKEFGYPPAKAREVAEAAGIGWRQRPQEIEPAQWVKLAQLIRGG